MGACCLAEALRQEHGTLPYLSIHVPRRIHTENSV